ncbi:MAG: dUTP diphosphatase [Clostridiales bacterium]|nr:dUTP diphosphatase [Clostridiales bacterium]
MNVEVFVEICREGVALPVYAKHGDAGMDVMAAEEVLIAAGQTVLIPTGLRFAIPEGFEIQVRPRSGISLRTPLRISNSPGTIDSGYRDELAIIMTNTSNKLLSINDDNFCYFTLDDKNNQMGDYLIKKGDRIAQIVLKQVPVMKLTLTTSVSAIGSDRGGGFGSTGVK